MDPNTNLKEQREIFSRLNSYEEHEYTDRDYDLERLAELAESLDEWISKGGFLPDAWSK